eukprot:scpid83831/ scgid15710/ 
MREGSQRDRSTRQLAVSRDTLVCGRLRKAHRSFCWRIAVNVSTMNSDHCTASSLYAIITVRRHHCTASSLYGIIIERKCKLCITVSVTDMVALPHQYAAMLSTSMSHTCIPTRRTRH